VKQLEPDAHLISISRIRKRAEGEISMLRLRGSVRGSTSTDFRTRLDEAGLRSPHLVVDLSELEYINSTGLGMLLRQSKIQERRKGWMRVVAPSPAVAMILRLTGVAEKLSLHSDEEGALRDLPARAA
jgi:anti-sigma B factor antagonist